MDGERELRSLNDLEMKLGEVFFLLDEVVPESIRECLKIHAKSHGTTEEL